MKTRMSFALALTLTSALLYAAGRQGNAAWTAEDIARVADLSIRNLEPLGPDPTNRYAEDAEAAKLGQGLFFDASLSANGKVSCASCHQPERAFQDGTPLAHGVGTTNRRTMPITGTAHSPFLFWDGRKDSQWSQALGPLESPAEHGGTRAQYTSIVAQNYRASYERVFGALSEASPEDVTRVFVNIGKAIAAYERRIEYAPSRFDRFADELEQTGRAPSDVLTADEVAGLRLFIGKANCTQCHNGPLFTNNEFHNTGVPADETLPADRGRIDGAKAVLADEFNCRSRWSDADPKQCSELEFLSADGHELERAYKVPSLRGVADRAPYMHAGQIATLDAVVAHYNRAPQSPAGHTELKPLRLSERERHQLIAFLRTLSGTVIPETSLRPE